VVAESTPTIPTCARVLHQQLPYHTLEISLLIVKTDRGCVVD
jgi:hypothetical protein